MFKAVLAATALGVLMLSAPATPSAALPVAQLGTQQSAATLVRYHAHGHMHAHFRHHRVFRYVHHGRYVHRRFVRAGGAVYAFGYGGGCGWLHHRALVTGSPYWWHRYRVCRGWY